MINPLIHSLKALLAPSPEEVGEVVEVASEVYHIATTKGGGVVTNPFNLAAVVGDTVKIKDGTISEVLARKEDALVYKL